MSGWFAMKRGTLEHEIFSPVGKWSKFEAWTWMVENAAFKPMTIDIGGRPHTVPRGSLCFSERFIAGKFRWSQTALRTFLRQLERHGAVKITVAKTGSGTKSKRKQITLCNYDKYQSSEIKTKSKQNQNESKEEQVNKDNNIPVGETGVSATIKVSVLSKAVWDAGKPFLASLGVKDPGAMIGRWLKTAGAVQVLEAIEAAQKAGTQDPIPYITEILSNAGGDQTQPAFPRIRVS